MAKIDQETGDLVAESGQRFNPPVHLDIESWQVEAADCVLMSQHWIFFINFILIYLITGNIPASLIIACFVQPIIIILVYRQFFRMGKILLSLEKFMFPLLLLSGIFFPIYEFLRESGTFFSAAVLFALLVLQIFKSRISFYIHKVLFYIPGFSYLTIPSELKRMLKFVPPEHVLGIRYTLNNIPLVLICNREKTF